MSTIDICPNCGSAGMRSFFQQRSVPVNSCILLDSPEEARSFPRGDIDLSFCAHCGFVSNVAFDPSLIEYSQRYEESQSFSPTFSRFHAELAQTMVDKYDLRGKDILEVGCGKGEFLNLVCGLGGNRGVGFDPGYMADRQGLDKIENVSFIADFYSEKYSDYQADFVCCKMTLEHIPKTAEFLAQVGHALDDSRESVAFFQVPDSYRILKDCAYEDVYYEHCSYFSEGSLTRLFSNYGLEILHIGTEYDNQYLTIEAKKSTVVPNISACKDESLGELSRLADSFSMRYQERVRHYESMITDTVSNGGTVLLWGSGSKGVSFLSSLSNPDAIKEVVDINPYRQGHYMSGFGQRIISPDELRSISPDLVIVMNSIYEEEIRGSLGDRGLNPSVVSL